MSNIVKSLDTMTIVERSDLLEAVANALETTADVADDEGDHRFASNSMCLANTIRGLSSNLGLRDLTAAELLLEQGIMLVHQYTNRKSPAGKFG